MYFLKQYNSVRLGVLDWSWTCHPVVSTFCVLRLQVCTTTSGKTVSALGLNIWDSQKPAGWEGRLPVLHQHCVVGEFILESSGINMQQELSSSQAQCRLGLLKEVILTPHSSSSLILTWIRAAGSCGKAWYKAMPLTAVTLTSTSFPHWSLLGRSSPASTTHHRGELTKLQRLHSSTLYFRSQNHDRCSCPSF